LRAIPGDVLTSAAGLSVLDAVLLLEALHTAHRVDNSLLTGVERVARAADFNSDLWLRCPDRERVAAEAGHLGVFVVFRVYFLFHGYTLTLFWNLVAASNLTSPSMRANRV